MYIEQQLKHTDEEDTSEMDTKIHLSSQESADNIAILCETWQKQ